MSPPLLLVGYSGETTDFRSPRLSIGISESAAQVHWRTSSNGRSPGICPDDETRSDTREAAGLFASEGCALGPGGGRGIHPEIVGAVLRSLRDEASDLRYRGNLHH